MVLFTSANTNIIALRRQNRDVQKKTAFALKKSLFIAKAA